MEGAEELTQLVRNGCRIESAIRGRFTGQERRNEPRPGIALPRLPAKLRCGNGKRQEGGQLGQPCRLVGDEFDRQLTSGESSDPPLPYPKRDVVPPECKRRYLRLREIGALRLDETSYEVDIDVDLRDWHVVTRPRRQLAVQASPSTTGSSPNPRRLNTTSTNAKTTAAMMSPMTHGGIGLL